MPGINCINDDPRLPSGICSGCRKALQGNTTHVLPQPINLRTLIYDHPTRTSPHKAETCYICSLAKMDIIAAQKMYATPVNSNTSQVVLGKLCRECYLPEGTEHKCTPAALPSIETIDSVSGKSDEEQAAKVIREKLVAEASTSRGQKYGNLTLATGGPPIHVEIKKPRIESPPTATSESLIKYMHEQNFSLNQIKKEEKFLRETFGRKSVEAHSHLKVLEATHHTDEFFEVRKMEFDEKVSKTETIKVERPVAVVKDAVALFRYLHDRWDLDEERTFLKIGIDDGGGFLKFCLLVVNKEENRSANSVKDVVILAVVPGVKESYENVYTLWEQVGMNEISELKLAADLKIYNIVLGIGSHSSSHSCYICNAKNPFEKGVDWPKGEMRTLKSIRDNFDAWKKSGSKSARAKDFKNCTNLPMFRSKDGQDGHIRTVDLVPPCELHLLLGPVNHMLEELGKVWPETGFWVTGSNAYKRGQDHGKLNGNGCNQLLKEENLIHLTALLPENLSDYGAAFRAFAKVVQGCYTYKVSDTIKEDIQKFRDIYLKLNISVTPKVHIVFEHLYQFLADSNASNDDADGDSNASNDEDSDWIGLAMYSEQAFEAVHHNFKKRWENFKVNPDNENYDQAILRAVCCFNGLNTY